MAYKSAKYLTLYVVYFILMLMFGVLLFVSSCSTESFMVEPETPSGSRPSLSFTVAFGGTSRAAEEDGGYQIGEGLENYLDIANNNFLILFFDEQGKFLDVFNPMVLPRPAIQETAQGLQTVYNYQFLGDVPTDLPSKFKIVTLFNWPGYPSVKEKDSSSAKENSSAWVLEQGVTEIIDITTHKASQFGALSAPDGNKEWLDEKSGRLIPFYGVRSYDLSDHVKDGDMKEVDGKKKIKDGVFVDLSKKSDGTATPLPILRAMAKIEVILIKSPFGVTFESVSLDKVNSEGFCAPDKNDHSDYDHGGDYDLDFVREVHIPDRVDRVSNLQFKKVDTTEDQTYEKWIAYVPEYDNKDDNSYCSLKVKLTKPEGMSDADWNSLGDIKEKTIDFAPNGVATAETKRYDIWRNNIYRFTINSMTTELSCVVDVQPYAVASLNPDFGLTRDADGNVIVRDANGKLIAMIPYDGSTANVYDVVIGDMRYVEVMYNDVLKFREFVDANGKPNGMRQDFLATGWNIYDSTGHMTSCFIYEPVVDLDNPPEVNEGKYMEFDAFSNLILQVDGCKESSDKVSYIDGEKKVWTKALIKDEIGNENWKEIGCAELSREISDNRPDFYKIYYKSYSEDEALQTVLVVYEVDAQNQKTDKILTVLSEEGDVSLTKEYIPTDVIGHQKGVEVYEQASDGNKVLRYRFFNNGAYQVFYLHGSDNDGNIYDWDYYSEEGYRFSSFDHKHPRYQNADVYSRYDRWGNTISRSLGANAKENTSHTGASHNENHMVIDNVVLEADKVIAGKNCKKGDMIIYYCNVAAGKRYDGNDSDWKPTYCISPDGTKQVLI